MAVRHEPLVGIFDERGAAENAIEQLHNAGFNDDQICYSGSVSASTGGGGFLEAIKRFFTGNQATRSSDVAHELSNMGLSDDEADYYAQYYEAGRSIVAVNPGERYGDALTVLRSNGGYSYRSGSAYNQVGTPPPTGYDPTAEGTTPDNPQQSDYATQPDYKQSAGYDPQAADNPLPPNYEQAANTAPYNQQVAGSGYNPQAAGYAEQPPNDEQAANAASYNQQAAGSAYNPQAAGYTEQPKSYDQGPVNPDPEEERKRKEREERREAASKREDIVTDADTNP